MGASVVLDGLTELRTALKAMPAHLSDRATSIVDRRAQNTAAAVRTVYDQHHVTGHLADHVTVTLTRTSFSTSATVRSRSPHASLFEFGSQVRHTGGGANRGSMPPHPTTIPIAIRERRAMYGDLSELLRDEGFELSGTIG